MPEFTKTALAGLAGAGLAGALALGSAVTTVSLIIAPTEAKAQGFFSFWDAPPRPRKVRRQRPVSVVEDDKIAEPVKPTTGPLVLNVSIKRQRMTVYDANGFVTETPISSGQIGYATPTGVFSILEKNRVHFSNLYNSAPMPNISSAAQAAVMSFA